LGDVVLYNSSDPSAQKRLNLKQIAGLSGQSVEVSGRIPPNSYLLIAVHQTEDSNETMRDIVHRNQIIGKMVLRYWANN
jgi:hypothetical protein